MVVVAVEEEFEEPGSRMRTRMMGHASASYIGAVVELGGTSRRCRGRTRGRRGWMRDVHASASASESSSDCEGVGRAGRGNDVIVHAVDERNEVRVCVMTAAELVQDAIERHEMAPTAAAALGRALIGTSMMAVGKEDGETVQTFFKSDGILGNILCIADSAGNVKGRVGNSTAHVESIEGGLDVGGALGRQGTLSVSRTLPWSKEPYTGVCELHNGEISEDIAHYLVQSEQINSAIGIGVSFKPKEAAVEAAAGFLVTVMPDCSERTIEMLEVNVQSLSPPTQLINEGRSAEEIANLILDGLNCRVVSSFSPRYGPCEEGALKERMLKTLALLGREEISSIIEECGRIEMRCEFCGDLYEFTEKEVEGMRSTFQSRTSLSRVTSGKFDRQSSFAHLNLHRDLPSRPIIPLHMEEYLEY